MKKLVIILSFIFLTNIAFADTGSDNIKIFKAMFQNYAEKLDISKIDDYYTNDFVLVSNNVRYDYQSYKAGQAAIFKTLKSLTVTKYSDVFACGNKLAARVSIRLVPKQGKTHLFHVILIIQFKQHKIARLWEMTYPTWRDKV